MIHIVEIQPKKETYEVSMDWRRFPLRGELSVYFRVLHALSGGNHNFVVQCFPVGHGDYQPNLADETAAREFMRGLVQKNLSTWMGNDKNVTSLVIDATQRDIAECLKNTK